MHLLAEKYADKVLFLSIYISEAHAQDEWKLGNRVNINQHKTLEERIQAAKSFVQDTNFKIPMVVDSMENLFDKEYAVWPDRYFIVHNGKMTFIPSPGNYGYDRGDLEFTLNLMFKQE